RIVDVDDGDVLERPLQELGVTREELAQVFHAGCRKLVEHRQHGGYVLDPYRDVDAVEDSAVPRLARLERHPRAHLLRDVARDDDDARLDAFPEVERRADEREAPLFESPVALEPNG